MSIIPRIFTIIVFPLFLVGIILLQIFLSKRQNRWTGLMLPAISFIFSIIGVLGLAFYGNESTVQIILQLVRVFLVCNIPTIILMAIYFACREKFRKSKELDKMNIKDLN